MQNRLTAVLTAFLLALTICGAALRFINLGAKEFWHDECETALVLSGHSERELTEYLSHGPVSCASLSKFQKVGEASTLSNMYKVLREDEPGHAPLFYIFEYLFCLLLGSSPLTMRLVAALFSTMQLPAVYWLAKEIYSSKTAALFTTSLAALSPLLIYYAQEARDYSLGLLLMYLSSALLLYALRTNEKRAWIAYGATITLGLYAWLFMGIVVLSQAAFMLFSKWRWRQGWLPFGRSTLLAALLFVPWLCHMQGNRENFARIHDWLQERVGLVPLLLAWEAIPAKAFAIYGELTKEMEQTLAILTFLCLAAIAAAIFLSLKNRKILLPLLLVLAWILAFAVPDATYGGIRSIYQRHQTPVLAAILLIFPALILLLWSNKRLLLKIVSLAIAAWVLNCEIVSSWHLIKAPVWPTKAIRLRDQLPCAQVIKADQSAGVICQQETTNIGEILALSHALRADTTLLFVANGSKIEEQSLVSSPGRRFYLFNPSPKCEDELALKGYTLQPVAAVHHLRTIEPPVLSPAPKSNCH